MQCHVPSSTFMYHRIPSSTVTYCLQLTANPSGITISSTAAGNLATSESVSSTLETTLPTTTARDGELGTCSHAVIHDHDMKFLWLIFMDR